MVDTREFTRALILRAIADGAHAVEEIALRAGGMFPLELRDVLDGLVSAGTLYRTADGYALASPPLDRIFAASACTGSPRIPDLPLPHPLDHDWRFDPPTIAQLVETVSGSASPCEHVLLLGAPTLFAALVVHSTSPAVTLVDRNLEVVRALDQGPDSRFRTHQRDLLAGPDPDIAPRANVTLCDPPWYSEHYRAFLAQASLGTRIGGRVLVSLLPVLTRPSAVVDRGQLLQEAHQFGLHLRSLTPDHLGYESPPFELDSLTASGLAATRPWRRGDLAEFWKASEPNPSAMLGVSPNEAGGAEHWFGMYIDRKPMKLRGPFLDEAEPPQLFRVEDGDVLPTVSRRYAGRTAVDLWLWDNRVFGVTGRAAFRDALRSLGGLVNPADERPVPLENVARALALLRTIPGLTGIVDRLDSGSAVPGGASCSGGSTS